MSVTDELLDNNRAHAAAFHGGGLDAPPAKRVSVLACMDARLDPAAALGLRDGDAHVIRNAGGLVTDDAIRSLAISQHLLGTEEIVLLHHTRCGMLGLDDEGFATLLERESGERPGWRAGGFADLDESVRDSIDRLRSCPVIPHRSVRGFVYDVDDGSLREVKSS